MTSRLIVIGTTGCLEITTLSLFSLSSSSSPTFSTVLQKGPGSRKHSSSETHKESETKGFKEVKKGAIPQKKIMDSRMKRLNTGLKLRILKSNWLLHRGQKKGNSAQERKTCIYKIL